MNRLTAVIVTLIASAAIALAITAFASWLLIKVGIAGFAHTVAVMIIMPLAFAAAALLMARRLLLRESPGR